MNSSIARRYRLVNFFVDSTRTIVRHPALKKHGDEIVDQLKATLGAVDFDNKYKRWQDIDYPNLGLIEEYNEFVGQIIFAYSMGYFYPAVTSACCLAERILNRLVLKTRDFYKSSPRYKNVFSKDSFNDWTLMIEVIEEWDLAPGNAIEGMKTLKPIRHQTIHYNDKYDFEGVASHVINTLIMAIAEVFGVFNRKDIYLVFDVPGEVWVRKSAEEKPFVKAFVLPSCYYACAAHKADSESGEIEEFANYEGDLTDQEFVEARIKFRSSTQ